MKPNPKLQEVLAELKEQLSELYGERLDRLVLYGSQARGDAQPDSDIDVLVVLKGEVNPYEEIHKNSEFISELSLKHDISIMETYVSLADFEMRRTLFMKNVWHDGVRL